MLIKEAYTVTNIIRFPDVLPAASQPVHEVTLGLEIVRKPTQSQTAIEELVQS